MIETREFASGAALAESLAAEIVDALARGIAERGAASLVVSGGSTPKALFAGLCATPLEWSRVTITLADERWVTPDDPASNEGLVRRTLMQGAAAEARLVPLWGPESSPIHGAAACCGRVDAIARPFDVVVLGMGNDGHTASWFPGVPQLGEAIDPHATASCMGIEAPGLEHPRMTLTFPALCDARRVFLHIEGAAKRETLARAQQDGPVAEMPVRAMLRQQRVPVEVFWAPAREDVAA